MESAVLSLEDAQAMVQSAMEWEFLFSLAGVGCLLRTNSAALAERMAWMTEPWSGEAVCELRVMVREDDQSPVEAPHFRAMHHVMAAQFGAANVFVLDLRRRLVTGNISAAAAANIEFWQRRWLPILAGVAGPAMGVFPVHSACLARDGEGILIAGESGAGKSTLSVALAQRGFDYLSDDWTYCSMRPEGLIAVGMEARTKLLPDAVRHFPELAAYAVEISMNGELAFEVRAEETFGVRMQTTCRPRMMLFLHRHEGTPARFRPLDAAEGRAYFARNVERIPPQMAQAQANRAGLIEELLKLPCWRFEYSGPPDLGAERLETFFEAQRKDWGR